MSPGLLPKRWTSSGIPTSRRCTRMASQRGLFAAARLRAGDDIEAALAGGIKAIRRAGFALDYLEVRDAETLASVGFVSDGKLRILGSVKARRN
jgi:hypothetical protein